MFKKAFMSISTSTIVVSSDPLSPTPLASSAMKTWKHRRGPWRTWTTWWM